MKDFLKKIIDQRNELSVHAMIQKDLANNNDEEDFTASVSAEQWGRIYGPALKTKKKLQRGWMEVRYICFNKCFNLV